MTSGAEPIRIHPDNDKLFLFRGRPRVLICATEHYGSVVNRAFDFRRYLDAAAERGQTLTRLFLLFRELQSARNPHSSLKVESPDFVTPWPRTGPGLALDGEPRFDLEQWNEEFFARLDQFLTLASERQIVVELTLFSNTYADSIWALNPLRGANNLTRTGAVDWPDYTSLVDPDLVTKQTEYVRRIVQATHGFDNVYYELCNEPGGGVDGHVQPADVDTWQRQMAAVVREEEARLGTRHLLFWSQAFTYHDGAAIQALDASFADAAFDVVNVHPLPDVLLGGRTYQLGRFMGKQLQLREVLDFCRAAAALAKPCSLDEDNTASLYRDEDGWTIHRKRAWVATLSGCHYDYIDFSIVAGQEAGTAQSRRTIRSWMQHLTTFVHARDLVRGRPGTDWLHDVPPNVLVATFGSAGDEYVAYLADSREVDDPAHDEPIAGGATLNLPTGRFGLAAFSPTTGAWSPWIPLEDNRTHVELPSFRQDLVLVARRLDSDGAENAAMPGEGVGRRVAVVTGGGRGIGRAIALALAADGLHVHVVARTSPQVEQVVAEIRSRRGSACAMVLDVSQAHQVQTVLGGPAGARCGVPQILINAAGVFGPLARVADGDLDAWINTLLVNCVGTYSTCRVLLNGMLASGWGRIVNVSSAAAQDSPAPLNSAYTTSKTAVNWFTRCLAAELSGTGVTVNSLHPGEVQTDMWRDIRASAAQLGAAGENFRQWAALVGRTGGDPPENAVAAVRWLLADAADSINGEFVWIAGSLKAPTSPVLPPPPYIVDCLRSGKELR